MAGRFILEGLLSDIDECRISHSTLQKRIRWYNDSHSANATLNFFTRALFNLQCAKILQPSYAMFRYLTLLTVHRLLYYVLLLHSAACVSAAQDACIYRSGEFIVHSVVVVKHTIHIITSVPYDTVFQVNTDLTITVDNAPTSLNYLTTYLSRSTAIETINGSVYPLNELQTTL